MLEKNNAIKGVLFDLDGTLLDTAPDMVEALNAQRLQVGLSPLPFDLVRPYVGYGSRALMKIGFNIDETHVNFDQMTTRYLDLYEEYLLKKTTFFPHVADVLVQLDRASLPWGIVTNKPSRFALPLFDHFNLKERAACLVCGDTISKKKPDPEPILLAATKMRLDPACLVYVGDADIDMTASQRANMQSLVALYGYIHKDQDPYQWQASGYLKTMLDIIPWLRLSE